MSPTVLQAFAKLCRDESLTGPVLEIGAVPGPDCLLRLPALAHLTGKTGINLASFPSGDGIRMVTGDANRMTLFPDAHFGGVLCNSTLEHDPRFWLTLAEIRRVLAPGGLVAIGVPGLRGMGPHFLAPPRSFAGLAVRMIAALTRSAPLRAATATLGEHHYPGDYYRFTEQAVREVFLEGMENPRVRWLMNPPRIIGWARKPRA